MRRGAQNNLWKLLGFLKVFHALQFIFAENLHRKKIVLWLHECNFSSPCKKHFSIQRFYAFILHNGEISSGSDRFSDWMESRLAWRMNQIKINKHFELGNYWLSASMLSIVCQTQINRRWMSSTKSENKPRSVVNSSIQRCFCSSFPAACDLWIRFFFCGEHRWCERSS